MPKRQAEKRKPPSFYVFGVTRSGIETRKPAPRANALTTVLRRGGLWLSENGDSDWQRIHLLSDIPLSFSLSKSKVMADRGHFEGRSLRIVVSR